jgi:hypothetical protein
MVQLTKSGVEPNPGLLTTAVVGFLGKEQTLGYYITVVAYTTHHSPVV